MTWRAFSSLHSFARSLSLGGRSAPRGPAFFALFSAGLATLTACRNEQLAEPDHSKSGDKVVAAPSSAGVGGSPNGAPPSNDAKLPHIQFVHAPDGDVPSLVAAEAARAKQSNRSMLVYVGATWCEPCQHFHQAAAKGELDADLPAMTLLEFDADKDVPRLRTAGYSSTYIPLFTLPGSDGKSSGHFIQGGIKGEGAAKEIAPRLKKLLESGSG